MTLVEILCNRTRICRAAGAYHSRSDAPLFILEILFGAHYSVMRPALARARSGGSGARRSKLNFAMSARKARFNVG